MTPITGQHKMGLCPASLFRHWIRTRSEICWTSSRFSSNGTISGVEVRKSLSRNIRRIKDKSSYSTGEIARVLQVHPRTVQTWYKSGMKTIDASERPLLYMGADIKHFLSGRQKRGRTPLGVSQFFCLRCKKATTSEPSRIDITFTGKSIGRSRESVRITGNCRICQSRVTRFTTSNGVEALLDAMMNEACDSRLKGYEYAASNTDLGGGH
jgi:hypothetical protein